MAEDQGEQYQVGDATATTGGGASADRGGRDAGPPGPDPSEAASRPGTGGRSRTADDRPVEGTKAGPKGGTADGGSPGR